MKHRFLLFCLTLLLSGACARSPRDAQPGDRAPVLFPDYAGAAIPCNIAPLNFRIEDTATAYRCTARGENGPVIRVKGRTVQFPERKWRQLLQANLGQEIRFEIIEKRDGAWTACPPVVLFVAPDPVDRYLAYRLIEPTYGMAGNMCIAQRDLTGFTEKEIFNNQLDYNRTAGQCINCHSFQDYHTANMQFHVRQNDGGTIIVRDGDIRKVSLKADGFLSAGVYPSWHPTEALVAYSLNHTKQYFYAKGVDKTEVIDDASDLMLYDPVSNEARLIASDESKFETFPYWSPDGRWLYYASADISRLPNRENIRFGVHYDDLKYNLMRMPFDPATRTFGPAETVFNAAALDRSATFPRVSPDGKRLLFTMASFGQFHIWHRDADLYLMDLADGSWAPLAEVNSGGTESYHSWSSNGRWIVFSSRRHDGTYTRLYLSWFDAEGRAHKPFVIPQRDPDLYDRLFKSYNIPEFTVEPVQQTPRQFVKVVKKPATQAVRIP